MRVVLICCMLALLALFAPGVAEENPPDIYVLATSNSAVLADETGRVLVGPGEYSEITPLGDSGLFAARPLDGESLLGVIRADGEAVTAFGYSSLSYEGGRIFFTRDGLCGVMDEAGRTLIEPVYRRLVAAGEGGYLALRSDPLDDTPDSVWHVAPNGAERMTGTKVAYGLLALSGGMMEAVSPAGLYGYLNEMGEWAIEPRFAWCGPFRDGMACAAQDGGVGLIDPSGEWIVRPTYARLLRAASPLAPLLGLSEGAVALISPGDGGVIARFAGGNADAAFTGQSIRLSLNGRLYLIDYEGRALYAAPEDAVGLSAAGGCVVVQRPFDRPAPFSLVGRDGAERGAWQELSFAGVYEDAVYFVFAAYETTRADYPQGVTFYDEVAGTRRYGLLTETGETVGDGYLSLRRTGRALLTAETDGWIGLIRPDGTVIMSLEKAE